MLKNSLAVKISVAAFVMIIVSTVAIGLPSYLFHRQDTINSSGQEALSIAKSVASAIDGDQFKDIMASGEKTAHWQEVKRFADNVRRETGVTYLYVLDSAYDNDVRYFVEGYFDETYLEEEVDLGDGEAANIFAEEMYETLSSGNETVTAIYDSEGFGYMVSGFAPIKDSTGTVVGVAGIDMSVDQVLQNSHRFGIRMILIALAFCILSGAVALHGGRRMIGRPLAELTKASQQLAQGNMDIRISYQKQDELGALFAAFQAMADSTQQQVDALDALANGDLTVHVEPRSAQDTMGSAIKKMIDQLGRMFQEIRSGTLQVSSGASQIASASQSLATGSTQQAAAVQQLSGSISDVYEKTNYNAELARQATGISENINASAKEGAQQMGRMTQAMSEIIVSSQSIGKVIKAVNDIAFQTNILALNAAVEAARAGVHGKGFAVVANEVRNLANKSAEAAQQTDALIADTLEKMSSGQQIVAETTASFSQIIEGIQESYQMACQIAQSSQEQQAAIAQINMGIEQVSQVVQQNSATSEESAAASVEMSRQSDMLKQTVSYFQLHEIQAAALPYGNDSMGLDQQAVS